MKFKMSWPLWQKEENLNGKCANDEPDRGRWRDMVAFWILGMCNNYGYIVMLSAAHDIIKMLNSNAYAFTDLGDSHPRRKHYCQNISTGSILLADIVPGLIMNILSPFLPFHINYRVFIMCALQCAGFLLVAFANHHWMALVGVALTSTSSGLGEATFLAYSSQYHKSVIGYWSSGTGGAGIVGSFSYAGLISLGLRPFDTMLIMLIVPFLGGATFWILLRSPNKEQNSEPQLNVEESSAANNEMNFSFRDKIHYIPSLFKYMIPLALVFAFEYFINQGLLELVHFENIWLDYDAQYRWLQFDYQCAVFLSRSSLALFKVNKMWLMAFLQFLNVLIVLTEVLTYFTSSIWVIFAIVFWEGWLGGVLYVNAFYRMSFEIPENRRNFALGIVPVADDIGIALAGIFSIPTHRAICKLSIRN